MIVIGGSVGGMQAALTILRALPPTFPQTVALVLHRQKDNDTALLEVLRTGVEIAVDEVLDKQPIGRAEGAGQVWLAPANYHLLVEDEHLSLSTDDLVNFARPSIDVLFESAADACGPAVVGVILTGASADGAQGAAAIERRGGTVIVQDPETAECGIMPASALKAAGSARVLRLEEIAPMLVGLASSAGRSS